MEDDVYYFPITGSPRICKSIAEALSYCSIPVLDDIITLPRFSSQHSVNIFNNLRTLARDRLNINYDIFGNYLTPEQIIKLKKLSTVNIYIVSEIYSNGFSQFSLFITTYGGVYSYRSEVLDRGKYLNKAIDITVSKIIANRFRYYNIISSIPLLPDSPLITFSQNYNLYNVWGIESTTLKWYMKLTQYFNKTGETLIKTKQLLS